jgi:protein-tyrosine phosphatase
MGNICRSPVAEAVLRHKLAAAGLGDAVAVDSAGTHGYHTGARPDRRAQEHAARRGYDLSAIRARPVAAADFWRFDLILAMDAQNLDHLVERCPADARRKLGLLLERTHARAVSSQEVPDPYYGGPDGFEHVLDLVEPACDALVADLAKTLRTS